MEVGTAVTPLIFPFPFIKINQKMFLFKKKKKIALSCFIVHLLRIQLERPVKKNKNIFINFDAKK